MMDKRNIRLIVNNSGGTSSKGSKTYRVTIPNNWIERLGLNENRRDLSIAFDGEKIIISPKLSMAEYVAKHSNNNLIRLKFYDKDTLCTSIIADYTAKEIRIKNYINDNNYTAFGINTAPDWSDYLSFLEERCIPRTRSGLKEYLDAIGVDEYDPLEIIKKTKGRMAEDNYRIEVCKNDG